MNLADLLIVRNSAIHFYILWRPIILTIDDSIGGRQCGTGKAESLTLP